MIMFGESVSFELPGHVGRALSAGALYIIVSGEKDTADNYKVG